MFKDLEELHLPSSICTVIEADENGKCGWASLACDLQNVSGGINCEEADRLKFDILENAMTWTVSGSLDGFHERPLSATGVAKLSKMCITLGSRPKTTASVRDALKSMRDDDNFTMPLPFAAFASEVLTTTIVIWEPDADGESFIVYRSDDHKGVFFHPEATVPPIHLLYNSGKLGGSELYFSRIEARGHGATTVSGHHNFDRIVLKVHEMETFDGYLEQSWRNVSMPTPSPSSTVPIRPKPVSTQCSHIFVIGKKNKNQCRTRRSPTGGGKCNRHKKKKAGPAPPAKCTHGQCGQGAAAGGLDIQGSDEELDEEEELHWTAGEGKGKHTKTGKSDEAIKRLPAKVSEAYQSAFLRVHELHKTMSVIRV